MDSLNDFKVFLSCPGSHVNTMINHRYSDIQYLAMEMHIYMHFSKIHVVMIRAVFRHVNGVALRMEMSVCQPIHHFYPD